MPRWIVPWLYGVAVLHTLFGAVVFTPQWRTIANNGFWNTAGEVAELAGAVLFMQVGLAAFALAAALGACRDTWPPRSVGVWLLVLVVPTVVVMPASGYWLLLPPAVILARGRR